MSTTHPVIEIIQARAASGSMPGARTDAHRVALVVEGGGMRGVVTSAMCSALEYLGYTDAFDAVYGTSAGSVTGAFFVAGQAEYGTTIFCDYLTSKRFIDFSRLVTRRGPVMNLGYLLDHVMEVERPLDYERVVASPLELHILASSLGRSEAVVLPAATSREELRQQFRASALIPFAAGDPVSINGDVYCDAGIWDSIPYQFAERDGATHVLVLQSRPLNNPRPQPDVLERFIGPRYFGRVAPGALDPYLTRVERYNDECRRLVEFSVDGDRNPSLLALTPPAGVPAVRTYEGDRRKVVSGAVTGYQAAFRAFVGTEPEMMELLTPVRDGRRGLRPA